MRSLTSPKCTNIIRSIQSSLQTQTRSLHLLTEKPSLLYPPKPKKQPSPKPQQKPSVLVTQIVNILKSNDDKTWKDNSELNKLLSSHSLSSDHLFQITRSLPNSSTALTFVEHLKENSPPEVDCLSSAFEAAFELAREEPNWEERLVEVYEVAKKVGVPLSASSATHMIECYGKLQKVDDLMLVYDNLDTLLRDLNVRNALICGFLRNGRLDDALQVLDEMLLPGSEFKPNEDTGDVVFAELLKGERYGRRIHEDEIIELVSKLGDHGVFPDCLRLTQWITKFCKRRRVEKAWELLHAVMDKNGPIDAPSCNALLTGLGRINEYKKMNKLLKEMKHKGINPNVVTFGISINHLCKHGRIDDALGLLEKMRNGEVGAIIEPDVIVCNTIIDGLCKVGRVEEGYEFMRKMVAEGKCSPTVVTYNCLIDGLCRAGELERSLELFDEMAKEGIEPTVITLNIVVDGLTRHGKVGRALEFYREMKSKSLNGNTKTYTTLIGGFCGVNNIKKAMSLYNEMREKCTPDAIVFYTLISGLFQAGHIDDASSILLDMRTAGFRPDTSCYNVMIHGFCKRSKFDQAYELLKEMEQSGLTPDAITYNTLISYFCSIGNMNMAARLLKKMVKNDISPTVVTYGSIIHAYCSRGQLKEAADIFREMRTSLRIQPNSVVYNIMIDAFCQKNKLRDALDLLDDMKRKDLKPDTNTFNAIFKALKEENKIGRALNLMDRMIEEGCYPDYITLELLTDWLSVSGHADKLRQFVQGDSVVSSTVETGE